MPTEQKKQAPSPSILQRMFGVANEGFRQGWPQLDQAIAGRQIEMPAESAATSRIMPMGPFSKFRNPDAYAVTSPMGTIALNRELIEKDKQDVNDVLAHELAHVGQGKKGFLRQMYNPSQVENEAIDREAMRNVIRGDINLPAMKRK